MLYKIGYFTVIGAIIAILVLLLFTLFPIKGNYQIKIVQSGSMEPDIRIGSIVVIKPSASYAVGDIVTFGKDTKKNVPTTHRIFSSRVVDGVLLFTTKGDANKSPDTTEIRQDEIHGKVLFDIPFLGYIIDLARKPLGFVIFIVIPAMIIIYDEAVKIFQELTKIKKSRLSTEQEGGVSGDTK